jgi:hypothetical protein
MIAAENSEVELELALELDFAGHLVLEEGILAGGRWKV